MTLFYRRLFFWIFVLLFLVTAPVAILYSQGYRFDQYRKIFIHSGSITVKSFPSNVNIYLNGEMRPYSTLDIINNSITVNGLRPGNYNLRVWANGYKAWDKNIEVHSGVSTEFWNVLLIPENLSPQELNADNAIKYFPSASGKYIAYYKKNGDNLEIWFLSVKNNEPVIAFSQNGINFTDDPLKNIEWSPKENMLIIPIIKDDYCEDFLILDTKKSQESFFLSQVTTHFLQISSARWNPNNQNEIFFIAKSQDGSENNLYKIDITTRNPKLILEGIKAYDLSSSSIYCLRQNNIIYKTNLDGKNESQITLSSVNFLEPTEKIRLIAYDDSRQAIISEKGELFVHNNADSGDTLKKIADNSKGIQFSDDGKKLLYWNDNEINVLYLRKWDVQPRRSENEIQQIARFSRPIKNVFWYRDYEHVFFSTQNSVKIIELDPRDHRITEDILRYASEDFISSYDAANGIYYFLDDINGTKKLFYLYFPEQIGFFER